MLSHGPQLRDVTHPESGAATSVVLGSHPTPEPWTAARITVL